LIEVWAEAEIKDDDGGAVALYDGLSARWTEAISAMVTPCSWMVAAPGLDTFAWHA
jgi:hypothetical protein